jgi:hypothetical protein
VPDAEAALSLSSRGWKCKYSFEGEREINDSRLSATRFRGLVVRPEPECCTDSCSRFIKPYCNGFDDAHKGTERAPTATIANIREGRKCVYDAESCHRTVIRDAQTSHIPPVPIVRPPLSSMNERASTSLTAAHVPTNL